MGETSWLHDPNKEPAETILTNMAVWPANSPPKEWKEVVALYRVPYCKCRRSASLLCIKRKLLGQGTCSRGPSLDLGSQEQGHTIFQPISYFGLSAEKARDQVILNSLALTFDEGAFRRRLIRWILHENLPFRHCDTEPFRDLISYLSPQADAVMASGKSIKNWIMQAYSLHKETVRNDLAKAASKIYIAFDLWTSGNLLLLNGVVAHYLNKDYKSQAIHLASPE